ncbi:MAG: hypothetical protein N2053_04560 [Chitinispirillaceae bacterium]|nr:hypothetical protein [Chitinispirillaceae bacterium]
MLNVINNSVGEIQLHELEIPSFSEPLRKNDAIFLYGSLCDKPYVFLYEPDKIEVVCGPSCCKEKEIKLEECKNDNIPVRERRGGGGTVVLAPGMVVTIVVAARESYIRPIEFFDKIHTAMIRIFNELGVRGVEKRGISDLAIGEKKILGSSLYLGSKPSLFYYQSSLLVDLDISIFDSWYILPPHPFCNIF